MMRAPAAKASAPAVAVLPLGGTIACVPAPGGGVHPAEDPLVMRAVVEQALGSLPGRPVVQTVPVAAGPSADITMDAMADLVAYAERVVQDGSSGIVVTTGTDSLEEVAFTLDLLWSHRVPLVVTGAMRNPRLPSADGPGNVRDAVLVATSEIAHRTGALVAMGGEVHQAWQVQKAHTGLTSAFRSAHTGPVGQVQEDTFRMLTPGIIDRPVIGTGRRSTQDAVAIVRVAMGDDGRLLRELPRLGFAGVVIEVMGGGSVPATWAAHLEWLTGLLPVVYSPRTGSGPTLHSTYAGKGSERHLQEIGLTPAGFLPALKGRLLLQMLLRRGCTRPQIDAAFDLFREPRHSGLRPRF